MLGRSEESQQQENRLLRLQRDCDRAILHAEDDAVLLCEICRLMVEVGGYTAAWIGTVVNTTDCPRPVAQAGAMGDTVPWQIAWATNDLEQVAIAQNIPTNPLYAHWREAAQQGGYVAAIRLPLNLGPLRSGALHLYSAHGNAFEQQETAHLSDIMSDLVHGMTQLRSQLERNSNDLMLRKSIPQENTLQENTPQENTPQENEAKFRAVLAMASDAIIISNHQEKIEIFNATAEELLGYTHSEVLGKSVEMLIPENFRAEYQAFRATILNQPGQGSTGSTRALYALRKDGTAFPVNMRLSAVQVGNECFLLTTLTHTRACFKARRSGFFLRFPHKKNTFKTNPGDRKSVAALHPSEQPFRDMADNAPVMIWITDSSGFCTYLSRSWYDFTGQHEATGLGMGWLDAIHPDDRTSAEAIFLQANARRDKFQLEYRLQCHDGEYRWAIDAASPWYDSEGKFKGYIGSVIDITDRKLAEQALADSEARLKLAYKATRSGVWDWDVCRNMAHISEEYAILFGLEPTQRSLSFEGWQSLVHPDDRPSAGEVVLQTIQHHHNYYEDEYRILLKDGVRWVAARGQVFYDAAGNAVRMLGNLQDITERKQAEAALRLSEERYRSLVEATTHNVWIIDAQGRAADIAPSWAETTGQTVELGSTWEWLAFVHPDDRDRVQQQLSHCLQTGELYEIEYRVLASTGDYRLYWVKGVPVFNADGSIREWVGTLNDITEQRQAEESLRQSEATLRLAQDVLQHANQELEYRVEQRTVELSRLNDRLQQELQKRTLIQAQLEEQAQLLNLAHDSILTLDATGVITFWNDGAEQMYGWTAEQALGQVSYQLLHTQFPHPLGEIRAELITNRYWEGELLQQARNGTLIAVASRWVLQCDDAGNPLKVLEINNDITSARRVKEVQSRLAAIIESSDDAIISTTLEGTIDSWNAGAEKLYGYSAAEIVGRSTMLLLPGDRHHEEAAISHRLRQGIYVAPYETVHQHKDGQSIDVSLSASPLKNADGAIVGVSKIARDITRRKQAEAQLQLSSERISLANAELARASRLKDEFLAGMSHELRTPLNAILGLSEALLELVFGDLTAEQREQLMTIQQSGEHLLELINDILDLSKIESGKMELEMRPVAVRNVCESSLNFIKQQARHKRIKVTSFIDDVLTEVELDERRIRQVLVNLLSNAVKFTPDGGQIELRVWVDSFRETLGFSITDTGIGISPDNINKLFQPFVQLDSTLSRRYAGTGLGLVLVRRIAELHGGGVTVESQEGKGSRFTVILPWNPLTPTIAPVPLHPAKPQPLKLHQVLIIEDSQAAASQIARYLVEMGANPTVHSVGGGAMQIASQLQPDVIILDILLPDRSGWDVLAQLKTNPNTATIPVIIISVVDERSRAIAQGAAAYLLKPISRPQFQRVLHQVLTPLSTPSQPASLVLADVQPATSPVILLAEDNEANLTTVNSYLQAHGFQVVLARNGLEAIQRATQHKPDVILMDIQMPEMDGLEATQQIHADPQLQSIPIIALTALAMPGDRDRCLNAGAIEYLTKPISLKQLLTLLNQYIPHSRIASEAE